MFVTVTENQAFIIYLTKAFNYWNGIEPFHRQGDCMALLCKYIKYTHICFPKLERITMKQQL